MQRQLMLLLVLIMTCPLLLAGETQWQVGVEAPEGDVWYGLPAEYTLVVYNPPAEEPALVVPNSSDFMIAHRQPVRIQRNGEPALGYPVRLTPLRSGELSIPVFTLASEQTIKQTAPATIDAKAPSLSDELTLTVTPSADTVYAGQSIRLTYEWTTSISPMAMNAVNLVLPELEHPDVNVFEPWNAATSRDRNSIGIPAGHRRVIANWRHGEGQQVIMSFERVIQPQEAGEYEFLPGMLMANINPNVPRYGRQQFQGSRFPVHFDNNFFEVGPGRGRDPERVMARTEPVRITVKPLPEGAPEHFSGMVGRPDVEVSLERESVKQGEPVQISFAVIHPDIEAVRLPDLQNEVAFTNGFDIPGAAAPATYEEGIKVFRQTLFARRADLNAIPELVINYFNPETGYYHDYITDSLPVSIEAVEQFNISDSHMSSDMELSNSNTVRPDRDGIWEHVWGDELIIADSGRVSWKAWILMAFLTMPPIWLFAHWLPVLRQQWRRRRGSSAIACLRLQVNAGTDPFVALGAYLHRRAGLRPSRLTRDGIESHLSGVGVDSQLIEKLCQWIDFYQAAYGESSSLSDADRQSLLLLVKKLVRELETALPKGEHI